jgi:hypothetical protein
VEVSSGDDEWQSHNRERDALVGCAGGVMRGRAGEARPAREGGVGGVRRDRSAREAERRGWAQCCGVIPTCAGRAVGVGAAAGVDAERGGAGRVARRVQALCMSTTVGPVPGAGQAESEGRRRARRRARGGGRREIRPSSQRGRGAIGRADEPAWVAVRRSER